MEGEVMAAPRRTYVVIEYDGKDITAEISSTVLEFTYTNKASGEADEIEITFYDRDGKWITDWYPKCRTQSDGASSGGTSGVGGSAALDSMNADDWEPMLEDLLNG